MFNRFIILYLDLQCWLIENANGEKTMLVAGGVTVTASGAYTSTEVYDFSKDVWWELYYFLCNYKKSRPFLIEITK
jgi:hypothetical protein